MRPSTSECIILRRTNYGEADRIINFLTPDRGKLSAIAKGVRKPKSKLAGGLELFAVCDVTLVEGRGELAIVTGARLRQFFGNILKEYERMQLGYECVKRINQVAETISEPEFYDLLKQSLTALDDLSVDWRLIELTFRLQLLALLGHGINLNMAHGGVKLAADKHYNYDFGENLWHEEVSGRYGAEHIKLLRLAAVKSPMVLKQVAGIDPVIDDCLWLVRTSEV